MTESFYSDADFQVAAKAAKPSRAYIDIRRRADEIEASYTSGPEIYRKLQ